MYAVAIIRTDTDVIFAAKHADGAAMYPTRELAQQAATRFSELASDADWFDYSYPVEAARVLDGEVSPA